MLIHRSVSKLLMHAILLAASTVAIQAYNNATVVTAANEDGHDNGRRLIERQGRNQPDPSEHSPRNLRYVQGTGNTPSASDVIELISISNSKDRVTVRVKQNIIGNRNNCETSDKADFFFMVFKHGQTMEDICPFYRDVEACFERTVNIPCDPVSQTATITVYVKSSGDDIPGQSRVANPYVGRCFPDGRHERSELRQALSFTRTIRCGEWRPKYCSDVLEKYPSVGDGDYTLWPTPQAGHAAESRRIYCHNMRGPGKPEEYITMPWRKTYSEHLLPEGEVDENGYRMYRTTFNRIRVDMDTLKVDVADYTFTLTRVRRSDTRGVPWENGVGRPVPLGSCQGTGGTADTEVNLRGTRFDLADGMDFATSPRGSSINDKRATQKLITMRSSNGVWANAGPLLPDGLDTPKGNFTLQLILSDIPSW